MGFRSGLPQSHSSIYLIPLWLDILKRPSRVPGAACRGWDDSDPPKKRGGMRSQKAVRCGTPLFGPHDGSLSSSIYPCGKARNSPQGRGAERRRVLQRVDHTVRRRG